MQSWIEFLKKQKKEFNETTFKKWIDPIKVIKFDACNLYLECENSFQLIWFEEHIRPKIKNALYNNNNHLIKVHIKVKNTQIKKRPNKKKELFSFKIFQNSLDLNAKLSLFHVSKKNEIPFNLFCELLGYKKKKLPNIGFNPIFIHGPQGSGKTHLLMAAAALLKTKKNLFFVKAKTFTNHVVNAIRFGSIQKFRDTYRNVDLLLMDDVHILSGKTATQEEFFHTFNALHTKNSQIILTSRFPPHQISEMEDRLISRFEWGIVLNFEKAEKKDLIKILEKKLKSYSINLEESAKEFLVNTFTSPLDLQKALHAILLRINTEKIITLFDIEKNLKDLILEVKKNLLTYEKIIEKIADYFGIMPSDILGKSQTKECSLPRQIAMYFCRKKLNLTYKKLGKIFKRDHSTVMSSIQYIQKRKEERNENILSSLLTISKNLYSFMLYLCISATWL
jgi:chromosomal replication initiator protein